MTPRQRSRNGFVGFALHPSLSERNQTVSHNSTCKLSSEWNSYIFPQAKEYLKIVVPKKQTTKEDLVIPPISMQRKIALILTSHDDRIAEKLQGIVDARNAAMSIYEEWFVNFRFPGHESKELVSSCLGQAPDGWQAVPMSHIATLSMGVSLAGREEENGTECTVPLVQSAELADQFLLNTRQHIPESVLKPSSAETHPPQTIVIATRGAETGQLGILDCKAAIDESCCAVRVTDIDFGYPLLFLHCLANRNKIVGLMRASPQQSTSKDLLQQFRISRPPASLLTSFNDEVLPKFNRMHALRQCADAFG